MEQVRNASSEGERRAALPLTVKAIKEAAIEANLCKVDSNQVKVLRQLSELQILLILWAHELQHIRGNGQVQREDAVYGKWKAAYLQLPEREFRPRPIDSMPGIPKQRFDGLATPLGAFHLVTRTFCRQRLHTFFSSRVQTLSIVEAYCPEDERISKGGCTDRILDLVPGTLQTRVKDRRKELAEMALMEYQCRDANLRARRNDELLDLFTVPNAPKGACQG